MLDRPKKIAISQREAVVPSYGEIRDCLDQEWTVWIESLGAIAVPVPNRIGDVAAFCDTFQIDAIFLSGGNNFSSHVYDDPAIEVSDGSVARDATEAALVDHAIDRELPLIAWCRGMQVLQVYFGGQLCSTDGTSGHVATTHDVSIVSEAHHHLGGETVHVNSYHDFGVKRSALAPPLQELGVHEADGLVEAVYHPELPIYGCQWHPERAKGADMFNRALVHNLLSAERSS